MHHRLRAAILLVGMLATPALSQPLNIQLRQGVDGLVVLAVGDLQGRPVPEPAVAALRFMVQWHKRAPDEVLDMPLLSHRFRTTARLLQLSLPVSGVALLRETEQAARVAIAQCTLTGLPGVGCPLTLRLARTAETPWHVVSVSFP